MSKLSFRARALDATKPMPVYKTEEIPDLPDFAAINRAVPQMPTGMEKEEETEHHLQRALSAQQVYGSSEALVIPVPDIQTVTEKYHQHYKPDADYKPPRQYIHVQPFGMDQEIPDYDMDSEDEGWLNKQSKKLEVTSFKFETMMDRLEKGSGQTVMTLQEAKGLLKEDDDLIIAVYDYWLNKRLKLEHTLIPSVRTEKRDGSTSSNPYVAFRRRTEKMQTRKNRKNDEVSYEKMLKLRRDLNKALTILELMKRREKSKKELLKLTIEIVDKRYTMQDYEGSAYAEANAKRHTLPNTFIQSYTEYINARRWADRVTRQEEQTYAKKTKRKYNKRKDRVGGSVAAAGGLAGHHGAVPLPQYAEMDAVMQQEVYSSEEEHEPHLSPVSDHEIEPDDPDGPYAFRRKPGCYYHAPVSPGSGTWPWCGGDTGTASHYRYSLASLSHPRHCVGFVRRRYGRGGRVLLDRAYTDWDDELAELDLTTRPDLTAPASPSHTDLNPSYTTHIAKHHIRHFRPQSPVAEEPPPSAVLCGGRLSPTPLTEFSLEGYETHREQLLQMQRAQQEHVMSREVLSVMPDLSTPPGRHLTLDSQKAQFAVSAVCIADTGTSHTVVAAPVPAVAALAASQAGGGGGDTRTHTPVFHNGPLQVKPLLVAATSSSVFSTSPAANVLQLNYPQLSLACGGAPVQTSLVSVQSAGHTRATPITIALPAAYKIPGKKVAHDNNVIKDNNVVVMEVT